MKRPVSILITLSFLLTITAGGLNASAQKSANDTENPFATPRAKQKDFTDKIPASVRRGATPEAKDAWDRLTPEQREDIATKINKAVSDAKAKREAEKAEKKAEKAERKTWKDILKGKETDALPDSPLYFTDKQGGNGKVVHGKEREESAAPVSGDPGVAPMMCYDCDPCPDCGIDPDPTPYPTPYPTPTPTPTPPPTGGPDADGDGLPESFENSVADSFTPIYHVSAYETDQFATFANSTTQMVQQRLGQTPFSYFRVQPLGFAYNYWGQLVSVLRIDYLTLWDHDSGLVSGGNCSAYPGLTTLEGSVAHDIDNERSAVLVAAPVGSYTYNLDPSAYSAYSYYTAAHEGEPNDKSRYADFGTDPVPAGLHIHLALSLSKHGTYTFNPDFISLLPDDVIFAIIAGVDYYCYQSTFDYDLNWNDLGCLAAMYYAYGLIYDCVVERFFDQGGQFASGRVNVGEPGAPINGAAFIQDDSHGLYGKLANPVF